MAGETGAPAGAVATPAVDGGGAAAGGTADGGGSNGALCTALRGAGVGGGGGVVTAGIEALAIGGVAASADGVALAL
jgi:hypothetical protein